MTTETDGRPAFPTARGYPGMTLRDWVMGQCIAAAFGNANGVLDVRFGESTEDAMKRTWRGVAEAAAAAADAMLEARK